ncbi:unnamed protein product [Paramecium sonneborni]|uniref:Uncharacterized protein n=1 Tax=Paramecium sonneborni TaxID=65129 RepID=A0A8S1MY88_9CILI|nr:unnamed protein product [Paramecium sonneborni]CAD8084152.1 unnamed protein product [Paramecium sonneborni]CAD8084156.1 unnamed protein product [Paramecium sonneborni]
MLQQQPATQVRQAKFDSQLRHGVTQPKQELFSKQNLGLQDKQLEAEVTQVAHESKQGIQELFYMNYPEEHYLQIPSKQQFDWHQMHTEALEQCEHPFGQFIHKFPSMQQPLAQDQHSVSDKQVVQFELHFVQRSLLSQYPLIQEEHQFSFVHEAHVVSQGRHEFPEMYFPIAHEVQFASLFKQVSQLVEHS